MASASASGSNTAASSQSIERRPPGSRDPTWKHGYYGPVPGSVICTWCKKKISGGINRLKYHLAGIPCHDARACPIAPAEVRREMEALLAALDEKKLERAKTQAAIQAAIAPNLTEDSEVNMQGIVGSSRGPRIRTPSTSSTSSKFQFFVPRNVQGSQPSLEGTGWNKEVHKEADKACANFWFYNNLPFNVARSPYWECLVTALTVAGKGYKAPSPRDISGRLLEDAIVDAKGIVEAQKKQWQKYGCSILSDGWTDGRNRTLINFIVASNGVLVFLKSIDASNIIKNAENLSLMLERVVLEVGIKNVVQVVTDNAAAYVAAGRLLQARHPTLFWTPCAAHCLDLLLEDIGKIDWVKPIVEQARDITKYIYNHPWVLQLMRDHTKGKELVRSGATRFATNFLTLQSITSLLTSLKQMFVSQPWVDSTYSKKADGEKIQAIIFDSQFATRALEIVKVTEPLVRVLRLVDGEKNVMGYLYEAMDRAKEAIQHYYMGDANRFNPIWDIIDRRWNNQLHQPIHAAGYFLNPKFYFSDGFTDPNGEVMEGLFTCIDRMTPQFEVKDLILIELQQYKAARGPLFSSTLCERGREIQTPCKKK